MCDTNDRCHHVDDSGALAVGNSIKHLFHFFSMLNRHDDWMAALEGILYRRRVKKSKENTAKHGCIKLLAPVAEQNRKHR